MANLNKKEDIISMPQMKLDCINVLNISKRTIAAHMLGFIGLLTVCQCLDFYFLRRLSQPLIVAESIVGVLLSNLPFIRKNLSMDVLKTLGYIVDFGMIIHMFGVGLEINPNLFFQIPLREAKVAMAGMFTAFILCTVLTPFLHVSIIPNTIFDFSLSLVLTSTASPILTSLVTDLKIAKSDIGKFVISAGMLSDLVPTLFLSLGYIIYDPLKGFEYRSVKVIIRMSVCLVIETLLAAKATPILMNWVNRANPEGKSMKGSHLVLTVGFVVLICSISPAGARFSKVMSAFLAGFVMPKEGRISKMMIRNAKGFGRSIFFPLFFFWVGTEADLNKFEGKHIGPWVRFFFVFVITTLGKVAGSVASGVMLGFRWPDSVAIGLLLSIKGHFQVYLAIFAARVQLISVTSSIVMLCVGFLTIIYTPLVVENIIERARKRSPIQKMALQWPSPSNELRIMLCLNGPQHLKSAINFMEISRGPIVPGLTFYVTDMVELTDKIAASLTHSETSRGLTMTDQTVTEMRENITTTIQAYLDENGEGVNLRRNLALSTKNNMHQDICILADNLQVSIIILPFHKDQEKDGKLNGGCSGFRNINRKVFRNAPCSVGILVDRGLGSIKISRSSVSINVAIVFIGGKDDREALAFAGRVARHPGVKLTVIRFLLDPNSDGGDSSVSSRITRARANTAEHTEEMKLDDEYFADFYSQYVAGGPVAYVEKYLVNSGQTFSTLRSLEGQYALFIVGRGGRVNSVLTIGMNDWEECPELGPIGDILSASDFSVTSSVLVIQQHSLRGELQGLQDEFSIM